MRTEELDRLLEDIRRLASGIDEANAYWSGGTSDLERIASKLSRSIDTLPGRIADAIADALAKQHRMIVLDVQAALGEFAAQLETTTKTTPDV